MESEDFIDLQAFGGSENGNNGLHNSNSEPSEVDGQHCTSQVLDDTPNGETVGQSEGGCVSEDGQCSEDMDFDDDLIQDRPVLQETIEFSASVTVEKINGEKSLLSSEDTISRDQKDEHHVSGVKRARRTDVDQEPSVRVIYTSLSRDSKRKLEVLLQQWSEWHALHVPSSSDSSKEATEYGDETYFPAIHVGFEKSSTVSFWLDNQARSEQSKESISMEGDSAPMYDRGYALGLTSVDGSANSDRVIETSDAPRCFNCSSYNHSLKECPKPRDNAAVNNARKQHNSKRNPAAGPRLPSRYYKSSPGGKFEGLRPGFLGAETRQCLGIGELDPPPWLNRMREIGYPPGYLDSDSQEQPSGITIYADEEITKYPDEETKEESKDGEILEDGELEPPEKKMTVAFPGINAPIPENADHRLWAAASAPSNRSHFRSGRLSEGSKGQYRDYRRSRDYRDEGPPGVDQGSGYSTSAYGQRYGGYDSNYPNDSEGPRGKSSTHGSPSFGRSLSDRGWRSPLVHESSPGHSSPYSSSSRYPMQNYGPPNSERWANDIHHNSSSELSSSHRKDRHEHHRK